MRKLLLENRKGFILYILGALITAVIGVMGSVAMATGFSIFDAKTQTQIIWRIVATLVIGLSPIFLQYLSRLMRIGFMRDVLSDVRLLAYQKIMKIPIEEFREKSREEYVSNLVSDINVFEKDFFLSILNIIYSYGSFVLGEIILLFISPTIALIVLLLSVVIYFFTNVYEKPIRANVEKNQKANAQYNEHVTNILGGLEVIKLYQVEERFRPRFYKIVEELEAVKRRSNFLQASQENIIEWIGSISQIGLLVFSTYLFIGDRINLGSLILVFSFTGQMIWSNVNGASMINRLNGSIDIFNRITSQPVRRSGHNLYQLENVITVQDLAFSYGDQAVLKAVNFRIPKGSRTLIHGPSGTGKTTLLNCLTQNLTSYQGNILIDETELKTIDFESLLDSCGYVRQQHFLFEGSILDNIILGQPVDEAKLTQILQSVDLWNWIKELDLSLGHLLVANGSNISGGQRQRISIARELYHNRSVLFVDEPSASLDDETAEKLYDTLFALDKTLILVSHRHLNYLSKRVDQIISFDKLGECHVQKA